jgi:hypothetical protein
LAGTDPLFALKALAAFLDGIRRSRHPIARFQITSSCPSPPTGAGW